MHIVLMSFAIPMKFSKDILNNLRSGDKKALDELFYFYNKRIYLFCLNYFHNKEESEEIVQEVFLKIWLNRKSIICNDSFESYIFTLAKNLIANNIKKKVYYKAYQDYKYNVVDGKSNSTENEVIYNELELIYNKALQVLPEKRKQIFLLSRKEGLSYKQIAERLNISIKTVETQMQLALNHFKEILRSKTDIIISFLLILLLGNN
jgi:RNA polymerase sigma-70 factor, ECF subfamily